MGSTYQRKVILLAVLLLLTAYGVIRQTGDVLEQPIVHLSENLQPRLGTWMAGKKISLSAKTVSALDLDDYLYREFVRDSSRVTLYIGYYNSQKKVGAAHSPLVCFSGQGWNMSDISNLNIAVGEAIIHLERMVIQRGEERQLVLYWFQAYDQTSSGTFMQKIYLLLAKLMHRQESNAFVRIMVPISADRNLEEAQKAGIQFIKDFYPVFKNIMAKKNR